MLFKVSAILTALYLRLLGARRRVLRLGEVRLVYYVIGPRNGEPWVLLHGLGSIAATWSSVMRGMRRSCRMVVPELSALGGTKCPGDALGIDAATAILQTLIDRELGGRPVSLAGLSLGGWMAVRMALAHPGRVSRLALINAGGYRNQDWERIESLIVVHDLAGVDRLYQALFQRIPWVMRLSRGAFLRAYTSRAVRGVTEGLSEGDTYDDRDLARLRMPTALIWAEHDGLFTVETARAMAAAIPHSRLEILRGCGHAVHMECPRGLVAALERFRRAAPGLESLYDPRDVEARPWPARSI